MATYEVGAFEWLADLDLEKVAPLVAGLARDGLVVVPGCGTSGVSALLSEAWGFRRVLSLDSDAATIAFMRRAPRPRGCAFEVADATDCEAVVGDGAASLVVDKSTLDCLLCGDAAGYLRSVARMLRVGGHFLLMSFHSASFLERALCVALPFEVEATIVEGRATVLLLRRLRDDERSASRLVDDALLRPTVREAELAGLASNWGETRPLAEAYDLLISDDLKVEYRLEDFKDDARAFRRQPPWTLEDALEFLRETQ